jgi:hypothetical protein
MAKATRILTAGLAAMVVVGGGRAIAAEPNVNIVLSIGDGVGLPARLLDTAKQAVARIYRQGGVTVVWADETPVAAAGEGSAPRLFVIIVPAKTGHPLPVNQTALGVAVTSTATRGTLVYILYNRVEQVATDAHVDVALLLGATIAHEIGHLLLPGGHSPNGLMRADWNKDDLREAMKGRLLFTGNQAAQIRQRSLAAKRP